MARREKAPKRPSLRTVLALGAFSALLGATLAVINLVSQPVQEVSAMPAEGQREPGMVYLVRGSQASSPGWRTARNQLERGVSGNIRLTEADLNTWAGTAFGRARPRTNAEGEESAPGLFGVEVNVTGVNFRIIDNQLQMAAYLEVPKLLPGQRITYQVRGDLTAGRGGGLHFSPREGSLGRAPLGNIPIFASLVNRSIMSLVEEAPEVVALKDKTGAIMEVHVGERHIELVL